MRSSRLHNPEESGQAGFVKHIRIIYVLPAVLLAAISARLLGFAGLATLRDDAMNIFEMFFVIVDAAWTWLATPPLWATALALIAMVVVFTVNVIGGNRLVAASRFIYRKDARIARFKLIEDDETIRAYRVSFLAERLLTDLDWTPIEALEPPPPERGSAEGVPAMIQRDFINRTRENVMRETEWLWKAFRLMEDATEGFDQARGQLEAVRGRYAERLRDARNGALDQQVLWERYEKGASFYTKEERVQWHQFRCELQELNRIKLELRERIQALRSLWFVTPDAETVRQLLQGIEEETQRKTRHD